MSAARPAAPSSARTRSREAGQATVELALTLPLVVLLLVAVVQVGIVVRDQNLVTHAAREAARAAAVDADPQAAVRAARQAGPLDPARLQVELHGRDGVGSHVRATVRYTTRVGVPVVGPALDDIVLRGSATMRVER